MQNRLTLSRLRPTFGAVCALALSLSLLTALPARAEDAPAAPKPRKEIGDIYNAARTLAQSGQYPEALAKLAEADAFPNHTPEEDGLLSVIRIIAALATNNTAVAAKAYATLPEATPQDQRIKYTLSIATRYFNDKDYANAVDWSKTYMGMNGPAHDQVDRILLRSYYFLKDYPNAMQASIEALSHLDAAATPNETDVEILGESALKIKDREHYGLALTKLVAYYPSPDRWDDLVHYVIDQSTFQRDKHILDVWRLLYTVGAMTQPEQYEDYALAAEQVGFPGEASLAMDKDTDQSPKTGQLRAKVKKDVDTDQKSLPKADTDAHKAASGDILVKLGIDYYGYGQYDKAITTIQEGIAKGGLKVPDDAQLALGIVYLAAGQKDKAVETFKSVTKTGGDAELAQLWALKAGQ